MRDIRRRLFYWRLRQWRNFFVWTILSMAVGATIAVFTLKLLPDTAQQFVEDGQDRVAEWKKDVEGRSRDDSGLIALETMCPDASQWKVRKAPDGVRYWSCQQGDDTVYYGVASDVLEGQQGSVECTAKEPTTWRVQVESGDQVSQLTDVVECRALPEGLVVTSFRCERALGRTGTYVGTATITNYGRTITGVRMEVTTLSIDSEQLSRARSSARDLTHGGTVTLTASKVYGSFFESFLPNVKFCDVRLVRQLEPRSAEEALEGRYKELPSEPASNLRLPVPFNPR